MEKIAVGSGLPGNVVDLDAEPVENLTSLARAKCAEISRLVVCVLDRPRNHDVIAKIHEAGARIMLIVGSVLVAAALRCIGGQMHGRFVFGGDDEKKPALEFGITGLGRKYLAPKWPWAT